MSKHPLCDNIPFPANTALSPDDHVSLFSSPDGSLLIFAASDGVRNARAYHSANDYEPLPVIGGIMQSSILDYVEAVFIAACWESTRNFRHDIQVSYQKPLTVCNEPRVLMSLYPATAYSTCVNCADLIITHVGDGQLRQVQIARNAADVGPQGTSSGATLDDVDAWEARCAGVGSDPVSGSNIAPLGDDAPGLLGEIIQAAARNSAYTWSKSGKPDAAFGEVRAVIRMLS